MAKKKPEQQWTEELGNMLGELKDETDVSRIEKKIVDVLVQLLENGIEKRELSAYMQLLVSRYTASLKKVLIGNHDLLVDAKKRLGRRKSIGSTVIEGGKEGISPTIDSTSHLIGSNISPNYIPCNDMPTVIQNLILSLNQNDKKIPCATALSKLKTRLYQHGQERLYSKYRDAFLFHVQNILTDYQP